MQCPICDQEMRFGQAMLKGTFFSFLYYGFSYKNLCFEFLTEPGTGRLVYDVILESNSECNAWNCAECEITLLDRRGRTGRKKVRGSGQWWEKYH